MKFKLLPKTELNSNHNSEITILNFSWMLSLLLLSFMFFTQVFVIINFLFSINYFQYTPVTSLFASITLVLFLFRKNKISKSVWIETVFSFLIIIVCSILLAGLLYDMSWDGLWYHQTAVFQMSNGWNPIYNPLHNFTPHLQDWVRHYAKGQWYIALGIYNLLGNIEYAKAATWIAMFASFFTVFATAKEFGLKKWQSILLSFFISFNPVIVFELASFLVDGLMISFLGIFVTSIFSWIKHQSKQSLILMIISSILCINTKQTGLVYLCFAIAAAGLYLIINKREVLKTYIIAQVVTIALGVFVIGYNPYITNTITRDNPFYPMLGSDKYPSLAAQGEDPIEKWETPHNMMGTNRFKRLAYAIFGRPGAQPYYPDTNANLMIPFDLSWNDFAIYYFHDVRISGFGPLFSPIFLLSLFIIVYSTIKSSFPKSIIFIVVLTIIFSLLISEHTWWSRYGPQLWWIPVFALTLGFILFKDKLLRFGSCTLIGLLIINLVPIYYVHYKWEVEATIKTNQQIEELKKYDNVEIDFQYFGEPFGERLKAGGVNFIPTQKFECENPIELMSVSPGYPCAVRACIK